MPRIEAAGLSDLPGAYRTCLLTGAAGQDATGLCREPDLLGHVYVGPYLAYGSDTQLVVVDEKGIAGYLLSADDTLAFEAWAERAWWPRLRARYPLQTEDTAESESLDAKLIRLIHEPPRTSPELAREYPAHLHIDLQARTRGSGMGRVLVERLLDDLRARNVPGVHLGVDPANTNATGFYEHLGFRHVGTADAPVMVRRP